MIQNLIRNQEKKQNQHGILLQKDSQSQQEQMRKQQQELRKQIKSKRKARKDNKKVVVGAGFSFDITEFFKFSRKKNQDGKQLSIFDQISGGHLAWFILIYSVCNSAMIPPWIMSIKASKFLRISWRFLFPSIYADPLHFILKENSKSLAQAKICTQKLFDPKHLKLLFLSALSSTFWFTCILTCFQWTYVSHVMVLGSLSNFFLSLGRSLRRSNHQLQPGGQVLIMLGILFVFQDSLRLNPDQQSTSAFQVVNPYYLHRTWFQRVLADLGAIFVAFACHNFQHGMQT